MAIQFDEEEIMGIKTYIFRLDYGKRMEERTFIKDVLSTFDKNTAVGCGMFVNNNIYSLEFLFFVSLEKDFERFDKFIKDKYIAKKRALNFFMNDIIDSFADRGYNVATFVDCEQVDLFITDQPNELFLWPSEAALDEIWKSKNGTKRLHKVFLSHSSKDEKVVDMLFDEFQKSAISAWYDKYQIEPGDSITDKINEGLKESELGIICISNSFLDSSTGWTKSELNYFVQRRMNNPEKMFIIVNIDVPHSELPPLVQDYKYIDLKRDDAVEVLIETIKKRLEG